MEDQKYARNAATWSPRKHHTKKLLAAVGLFAENANKLFPQDGAANVMIDNAE